MKYLKIGFFLFGIILLCAILYQADLPETWQRIQLVGGIGLICILLIYAGAFLADTISWLLTIPSMPLSMRWIFRLWNVRLIGYAVNRATPFASLGGEPVKIILLQKRFGVTYTEATTSIFLNQTNIASSLVLFLLIGFTFILQSGKFPSEYMTLATYGIAIFCLGVFGFLLTQLFQGFSRLARWLRLERFGKGIGSFLQHVTHVEQDLKAFYLHRKQRFILALLFAFCNWALGVIEIYYTMKFLGHPISLVDAWIIEAMTELVRAALFFIPGNIGFQEGTILIVCSIITGSESVGLSLALIRRLREIIWICWGIITGLPVLSAKRLWEREKSSVLQSE